MPEPTCRLKRQAMGLAYPKSNCDKCGPIIRPGWRCAEEDNVTPVNFRQKFDMEMIQLIKTIQGGNRRIFYSHFSWLDITGEGTSRQCQLGFSTEMSSFFADETIALDAAKHIEDYITSHFGKVPPPRHPVELPIGIEPHSSPDWPTQYVCLIPKQRMKYIVASVEEWKGFAMALRARFEKKEKPRTDIVTVTVTPATLSLLAAFESFCKHHAVEPHEGQLGGLLMHLADSYAAICATANPYMAMFEQLEAFRGEAFVAIFGIDKENNPPYQKRLATAKIAHQIWNAYLAVCAHERKVYNETD